MLAIKLLADKAPRTGTAIHSFNTVTPQCTTTSAKYVYILGLTNQIYGLAPILQWNGDNKGMKAVTKLTKC